MRLNIKKLRKKDIEWLATNYCRHKHSYLDHQNCYFVEQPDTSPFKEKVGFLDIECSNLHATFGYIFSYCIKPLDSEELDGRILTPKEIRNFTFDKQLMKEFVRDAKKYHRLVVHYGGDAKFDLPFLRSRCLKYDLDFPLYKEIYVTDTYTIARGKLRLHRNRLETICDFFGIPSKGHRLIPSIWNRALSGHKESLEYIWEHNIEDCYSLEAVWKKLSPYAVEGKRSI